MRNNRFVALCSALILTSGAFAFAELTPAGSPQAPYARLASLPALRSADPTALAALPPGLLGFIASFLLAAVNFALGLLRRAARSLVLINALLCLWLVLWGWFGGRAALAGLGVILPTGPLSEVVTPVLHLAGTGLWLWLAGAILMLMIGLLDSGERH